MLNQLIVTSVAAGARRPRSARRIALAKPPQFHIKNNVKLKGYIGKDAESFATKNQTIVVRFTLAVKSGYKDKQTQQWVNHTEWPRIVAFGKPADYAKALKKGDYVEIVGELHSTEREVEILKDKTKIKIRDWEVRASIVKKLAKPQSSREENLDAEPITEDDAA